MVPRLIAQFSTLSDTLLLIADAGRRYLLQGLQLLDEWGLLAGTPEHVASRIEGDLSSSVGDLTGGMLGDPFAIVSGAFGLVVSLFGVVFVAAYLLANSRRIKAAYLMRIPAPYRHDARDLWNALEHSFSRYMSGLFLDLLIQGAVSALVLYLIGRTLRPCPWSLGLFDGPDPLLWGMVGGNPRGNTRYSVRPVVPSSTSTSSRLKSSSTVQVSSTIQAALRLLACGWRFESVHRALGLRRGLSGYS